MRRNRPCPQLRCGGLEGSFLSFRSFWSKNWEFGVWHAFCSVNYSASLQKLTHMFSCNGCGCKTLGMSMGRWCRCRRLRSNGWPPLLNCVKWLQRRTLCWEFLGILGLERWEGVQYMTWDRWVMCLLSTHTRQFGLVISSQATPPHILILQKRGRLTRSSQNWTDFARIFVPKKCEQDD